MGITTSALRRLAQSEESRYFIINVSEFGARMVDIRRYLSCKCRRKQVFVSQVRTLEKEGVLKQDRRHYDMIGEWKYTTYKFKGGWPMRKVFISYDGARGVANVIVYAPDSLDVVPTASVYFTNMSSNMAALWDCRPEDCERVFERVVKSTEFTEEQLNAWLDKAPSHIWRFKADSITFTIDLQKIHEVILGCGDWKDEDIVQIEVNNDSPTS